MATTPIAPEQLLAHHDFVRALAWSLLADAHRADDVAQQTWLAALERAPRTSESIRGWLATVARNFARQGAREAGRRARREEAAARNEAVPSAEDVTAREETRRRIVAAVLALEEPSRSAVLLQFYEGLPPREAARRLGVPVPTFQTRVRRGIEQLRARLDRDFGGDRNAWSALLAPMARALNSTRVAWIPAVAALAATNSVVIIGAAAALLAVALWVWRSMVVPPTPGAPSGGGAAVALVDPSVRDTNAATTSEVTERASRAEASASTSTILGRVVDVSGRGVAGARVVVYAEGESRPVSTSASAPDAFGRESTSAADGRFAVVADFEAPFYAVFVEARGFAPRVDRPVRANDARTITLERCGAIAGTVRDLAGAPIARAIVRWGAMVGDVRIDRETIAGADGAFRIDGVAVPQERNDFSMRQWFWVSAPGFADLLTTDFEWSVVAAGADRRSDLFLTRGATVRGRVVDAEAQEPIAGAAVVLRSFEDWCGDSVGHGFRYFRGPRDYGRATTGADGSFSLDHVPASGVHRFQWWGRGGYAEVTAEAPGRYFDAFWPDVPREGATVDVELRGWPTGTIRGRVVDPEGAPVAGVQAETNSPQAWMRSVEGGESTFPRVKATSGADGRFELKGVPASLEASSALGFYLYKKGWDGPESTPRPAVRPGAVVDVGDLRMTPWTAIDADVVDAEGRPIWGASACAAALAGVINTDWVTTDRAGHATLRVRCDRADTTTRVVVRAAAPGFGPAASEAFELSRDHAASARVVLEPGRRISGRVLFASGRPARMAWLRVLNVEGTWTIADRARANDEGTFEIADLPRGAVRVGALKSDPRTLAGGPTWTEITVEENKRDIAIVLPSVAEPEPRGALRFRVVDRRTRKPVIEPRFDVRRGLRQIWPEVDPNGGPGAFRVAEAPEGPWTLHAWADGYSLAVVDDVRVRADEETERIEIALERGVELRGMVRDASGAVVARGWAMPEASGSTRDEAALGGKLEADGSFIVRALRDGATYRLHGEAKDEKGQETRWVAAEEIRAVADTQHIVREIVARRARMARIHVACPRLARQFQQTLASLEVSGDSRVEIRDANGAIVWSSVGVTQETIEAVLPFGEFIVRATVSGADAMERPLVVTESGPSPFVEFEIP